MKIFLFLKNFFKFLCGLFNFKTSKEKNLGSFFDWQIEKFKQKGISPDLLSEIEKQKEDVISFYIFDTYCPSYFETIPFVLVIPLPILKNKFDYPLFSVNQEDGCLKNICESIEIEDVYSHGFIPENNKPYFLFCIESGMNEGSIFSVSPKEAERVFEKIKLNPLNVTEMLSFLMIFDDLYGGEEKISLVSSRYRNNKNVPEFVKSRKGFMLKWDVFDNPDPKKVYPACWMRKQFFKK